MQAKFDFDEIAKVKSITGHLKKYNGFECLVVGRSKRDADDAEWYYAINIEGYATCAYEHELEATGKFANQEDHKSVGSIRVSVTPDGYGDIIEDEAE